MAIENTALFTRDYWDSLTIEKIDIGKTERIGLLVLKHYKDFQGLY
jgi:hypothetical protein